MPMFIVKGPYDWTGNGRKTVGRIQAASAEAAKKLWEKRHPDDDDVTEMQFEESQPRVECRCPDCGWTFKGTGHVGAKHGEIDTKKRCTLCERRRDVTHKKALYQKAVQAYEEASRSRQEEIARRAAAGRREQEKAVRRKPTLAEMRAERGGES
jgi:hypothetical protein